MESRFGDHLRADDVVVEMRMDGTPPLGGIDMPEKDEMQHWSSRADVAAVLRVVERTPHLTPREDRITTTVRARVVEPLKDATAGRGAQDAFIAWEEFGGELMIKVVRVIISHVSMSPASVGRDYLVFFRLADGHLYSLSPMFEADERSFRRIRPPSGQTSHELSAFDRAEAVAAIRKGGGR